MEDQERTEVRERSPLAAALYAVDSLIRATDEGRYATAAELRLVRALVAAISEVSAAGDRWRPSTGEVPHGE